MQRRQTLALACLALMAMAAFVAVPSAEAQTNPCNKITAEATCNKDASCVWCLCKAIPSSCFDWARE